MKTLLIAQYGPPAIALIRSLGKKGFSTEIYDPDLIKSNSKNATNDGNHIVRAIKGKQVEGITCIDEKIGIWVNENLLGMVENVRMLIPPGKVIKNLLSKERQLKVAEKVGFLVLPTYRLTNKEIFVKKNSLNHFPLCLRPSEPESVRPHFKAKVVNSQRDLVGFLKSLEEISSPIIAQPFMNLPNLVVHGARTVEGQSIGLAAFFVERKFQGVTLTIRPVDLDPELKEKCIAFTDEFGLVGNYHFEFLYDPRTGKHYFLEINNRFGGTTAKVYKCGYDEPAYALKAFGVDIDDIEYKPKNVTVSSKQALLKYMYYALTDRLTPLDYPDEPKAKRVAKALWGLLFWKDDVWERTMFGTGEI